MADRPETWPAAFELIRTRGYEHREEPFKLASGQLSHDYIDGKHAIDNGERLTIVSRAIADLAVSNGIEYDAVGGLTMGADPIAAAMLHAAAAQGRQLDAFVVRKAAKAHGLQKQIEGPSIEGRRVLVVEDTSTTGGSPLAALEAVRAAGAVAVGVATIADRATGAGEKIEAEGVPYRFAYSLADLGLA